MIHYCGMEFVFCGLWVPVQVLQERFAAVVAQTPPTHTIFGLVRFDAEETPPSQWVNQEDSEVEEAARRLMPLRRTGQLPLRPADIAAMQASADMDAEDLTGTTIEDVLDE